MSLLAEEVAKGAGGAGLPWAETEMQNVGDTVIGTVIDAELKQAFNPETKQPATWEKSGDPVMEAVIRVTGTGKFRPDLEEDNGDRAFHIRWAFENKAAFIEAMNAAGVAEPEPGGKFAAQLVSLRANGGVRKPTKLFRYEYVPPPSGLSQAVTQETAPPAAPASLLGGAPTPTPPPPPPPPPPPTAAQDIWATTNPDQDPWAAARTQAGAKAAVMATPLIGGAPAPMVTAVQVPVAAPAAPAATNGSAPDPVAIISAVKALLAMGMTDEQITAATGAPLPAVAGIRLLPVG